MKKLTILLLALGIFGLTTNAQTAGAPAGIDKGNFRVGFSPRTKAKQPGKAIPPEVRKVLQEIADPLNQIIALPRDVYLNFDVCGEPNAFYDPSTTEITMCYEFLMEFDQQFRKISNKEEEINDMIGGATAVIFFHELGHCLIDVWELPATGREEDAVDQLAVLLMLDGTPDGEGSVISAALFFKLASLETSNDDLQFWDEHSLNQQRFHDMLCLTYGSNPEKNKGMIGPDTLPEPRAARCPAEYKRLDRAWEKLLTPFLLGGA